MATVVRYGVVLAFASTAVSGCGEGLGPRVDVDALVVGFSHTPASCWGAPLEEVGSSVTGGERRVEISAIYGAPNGGYELIPHVEAPAPGVLVVTIEGHSQGGVDVPRCHYYDLEVGDVPRGRYGVAVIHVDSSFDSSHRVLFDEVVVR